MYKYKISFNNFKIYFFYSETFDKSDILYIYIYNMRNIHEYNFIKKLDNYFNLSIFYLIVNTSLSLIRGTSNKITKY